MTEMQRSCGVGGNILEQHRLSGKLVAAAKLFTLLKHLTHYCCTSILSHAEINEPRASNFYSFQQCRECFISFHLSNKRFSDCAGILLQTTRKLHRYGTGNIAVFGEFRALQRNGKGTCADSGKGTGEEANQGLILLIEHFCRKTDCSK